MHRAVFITFLIANSLNAQHESCLNNSLPKRKPLQNEIITCFHDSLQSKFLITIPCKVAAHFHQFHTENIFVLQGKAKMTLMDSNIVIKKGMHLTIPKGAIHSIVNVISRKPLVVISVQSPFFDGTDRVLVNENQK